MSFLGQRVRSTRAIRREHAFTERGSSQKSSSSVPTSSSMGLLERFRSTLSTSVSRCGHPPPCDNNCRSGGATCFRYLTISWQSRHSMLHKFQQSVVSRGLSPNRDMTSAAIQSCMPSALCRDETYVPDRCYFAHAAVYVCIAKATSSSIMTWLYAPLYRFSPYQHNCLSRLAVFDLPQ